jgi:hypothetical protein
MDAERATGALRPRGGGLLTMEPPREAPGGPNAGPASGRAPAATPWLSACPVCRSGPLEETPRDKVLGPLSAPLVWTALLGGAYLVVFLAAALLPADSPLRGLAYLLGIGAIVSLFPGLARRHVCRACGAVFDQRAVGSSRHRLASVRDTSAATWTEYGRQSLAEREWRTIAQGGMSDARLAALRAQQRQADLDVLMAQVREGNAPIRWDGAVPIVLDKGETPKVVLPNVGLLEHRSVRTGGYVGPSVRLVKGVRLSAGAYTSESHDVLQPVARGSLTVTDRRLVFSSGARTESVDLGTLVSVDEREGFGAGQGPPGVVVQTSGRKRPLVLVGLAQGTYTFWVEDRAYREQMSGSMFKHLVEGLARKARG